MKYPKSYYENKRIKIVHIISRKFNSFYVISDIDFKHEIMFFKLNFLFYTIMLSIKFSDIEKIKNYKELENFVINKKFEIIGKVMK